MSYAELDQLAVTRSAGACLCASDDGLEDVCICKIVAIYERSVLDTEPNASNVMWSVALSSSSPGSGSRIGHRLAFEFVVTRCMTRVTEHSTWCGPHTHYMGVEQWHEV
ncbi:uncharacterized protein FOMMEDRAFT_136043 [Fomitiporia mediterranea MF3/22]|uniref:uncharacterized protein n=1 Tax=Fomitiporia mediterranea (strain MF3/22) TaxID=694068 RepID=UPI0004407BC3|nr:uncharacterized protein FOMMEDRAFT_136043 [Fomitiporia mediterranea MF3/22]EJD00543.1 hypothetical protein FOMMEDRAFT_136043 [Fomitiporia mediterranea MF3/22]